MAKKPTSKRKEDRQKKRRKTLPRRSLLAGVVGAGVISAAAALWTRRRVPLDAALDVLEELPASDRMPAVFVGHGTPFGAIEPSEFTDTWARVGSRLPRPEAILMVSAHWLTRGGSLVTAGDRPRMNYDMYGFPDEIYRVRYPSPGDPELAGEVAVAVRPHAPVGSDTEWGYDHGTWLPLMYMFPEADIPLIQLSIDYSRPPAFHYDLSRRLEPFRSRGVMIMGSGNLVHNLRQRGQAGNPPFDWAREFDTTITEYVGDGDDRSVVDFLDLGPLASMAHPTYDHFLPLLYVLGVKERGEQVTTFNAGFQEPSVSMKSFVIV